MISRQLCDTTELMTSEDYRDRFVAEYWQTKIRYEKLRTFNRRIEAATRTAYAEVCARVESPEHTCPDILLIDQEDAMRKYLDILEVRAIIEGIDLKNHGLKP